MSPIELLLFVMSSTIIFGVIDCRPGSVYRNRLRKQLTTAVGNNRRLYSRYPCNRNAPTGIFCQRMQQRSISNGQCSNGGVYLGVACVTARQCTPYSRYSVICLNRYCCTTTNTDIGANSIVSTNGCISPMSIYRNDNRCPMGMCYNNDVGSQECGNNRQCCNNCPIGYSCNSNGNQCCPSTSPFAFAPSNPILGIAIQSCVEGFCPVGSGCYGPQNICYSLLASIANY